MVFHLDKCIGCHTCSIACKNIWTDRKGTEYMWWANVETKPGTGYPTLWEDQDKYKGGWKTKGAKLELKLQGKLGGLTNIFHNPHLPVIDDYYEPWTYRYGDLFNAPAGDDQPTARPVSRITGEPIDIESGPNWDDDLGGSPIYASNDPNLKGITDEERRQLSEMERMVFFYLPRICNHCINPACVASCPSGAIYKRGEDGIVLINQETCRAWRMCVSACPYKKAYYNWTGGKSEKCILCYPRVESGQAPACFHACAGRIRYFGVLLYDATKIESAAKLENENLVAGLREMMLDPFDPKVITRAKASGLNDEVIKAAQNSPVYKLVKEYQLALPLHPEFRTLPSLFYVPPLLPVIGADNGGVYKTAEQFFSSVESARVPIKYLANLFTAGNESLVEEVYKKLVAVRVYRRVKQVGDMGESEAAEALKKAQLTPEKAEAIFYLSAIANYNERYVVPPTMREQAIEELEGDVANYKGSAGFGFRKRPERRW
jgi:nitrate reductase beta subunit